jgi:hypothetical protein
MDSQLYESACDSACLPIAEVRLQIAEVKTFNPRIFLMTPGKALTTEDTEDHGGEP